MASRETWTTRVAEWKASGLSSPTFCAGKDFTAGGLRYWASRLRHGDQQRAVVRVAKVVRLARPPRQAMPSGASSDLVVEIGTARVVVRPGVDRTTLGVVVEVLTDAAARSAR